MADSDLAHLRSSDHYDSDEGMLKGSPLPAAKTVNLRPSISPPPSLLLPAKANAGDAMLVAVLGGGRNPDIAAQAAEQALPSDTDGSESQMSEDMESVASDESNYGLPNGSSAMVTERNGDGHGRQAAETGSEKGDVTVSITSKQPAASELVDLMSLAAGALAFTKATSPETVNAGPTPPMTDNDVGILERRQRGSTPAALAIRNDGARTGERSVAVAGPPAYSPYSPNSLCSPREGSLPSLAQMDLRSPTAAANSQGGLPPLQMHSPRSDTNGQTALPSLKSQLGDFRQLQENAMGRDNSMMYSPYPQSPPSTFPPMAVPRHHGSPPVSPAEAFQRGLPSPRHPYTHPYSQQPLAPALPQSSPTLNQPYAQPSQMPQHLRHRPSMAMDMIGYPVSPGAETGPGGEGANGGVRMNIDGSASGGWYLCRYPDCTAAPFQTQYLLNSHANVHSQARPHFCPVKNCPRSEGGKGFKRKNEMIRHGLVHDSPGYVCPFCPDREHRYPRPDNLQRHVRVHHVDKDKDDPLLRDVLSQRPDGPSRGRRRRGTLEQREHG